MTIATVNPLLTEELFQHIWEFRLFREKGLTTQEGEPVKIINQGQHNRHAGPDFTAARIRIGNTLWVGNVELHLKTSDWYRHKHQYNRQYGNVILHVVFEHDVKETTTDGIPCLALQPCIPKLLLSRYRQLRQSAAFVPCGKNAKQVPALTWYSWQERLLVERWERKTSALQNWLLQTKYNWEEVCYRAIAQSLGTPVNAMPLLQLAESLPYNLVMRCKHNPLQLEALLFGQAGMLETSFTEEYPQQLQQEYRYLRHKHQLQPVAPHLWKWLRMRPASFPTMRIACLAALLHQGCHLFSRILDAAEIESLEKLFTVHLSPYWQQHYRFDVQVTKTQRPGRLAIRTILINSILPLLYLYGREKGMFSYQERALQLISQLQAENNYIISGWEQLGIKPQNALDSQALLQLKQYYCDEKKCLQCAVGAKLLREVKN